MHPELSTGKNGTQEQLTNFSFTGSVHTRLSAMGREQGGREGTEGTDRQRVTDRDREYASLAVSGAVPSVRRTVRAAPGRPGNHTLKTDRQTTGVDAFEDKVVKTHIYRPLEWIHLKAKR